MLKSLTAVYFTYTHFFSCFKTFANISNTLFYSLLILNVDVSLKLHSSSLDSWTCHLSKIVTRTGTIQLIVPPEGELKTKENNSLKSMVSGA